MPRRSRPLPADSHLIPALLGGVALGSVIVGTTVGYSMVLLVLGVTHLATRRSRHATV